ncbi:MAG: DUF4901 domain-containing protein [Ruminococcus sp.]|nr:DUF4901 domain-containing protein [Ruminococcus sp.]
MKRKSKRVISGLLFFGLVMSALPQTLGAPVLAADVKTENAEAAALKRAVTEVKKRVDIPKNFDGFDYRVSNNYGVNFFTFTWSRTDVYKDSDGKEQSYDAEEIIVRYNDGNKLITYYEYNDYTDEESDKPRFEKLTAEEREKAAKKYFAELNPNLKGDAEIVPNGYPYSLYYHRASYEVSRGNDGIYLGENGGTVTVDTDTGRLLQFELSWWNDAEFPDASKRLTEKQVMDIYASRKPLEAEYRLFSKDRYDKEKDEYIREDFTIPVYYSSVGGENEIDALTGEYTSIYDDIEKYSHTDVYDWNGYYDHDSEDVYSYEGIDGEGYELSDAEWDAIEKENGYLSYNELLKIIKDDEFLVFDDNLIQASGEISSYTDDDMQRQTSRVTTFEYSSQKETEDHIKLYVEQDAYTGRIVSYTKYRSYGEESPNDPQKPPTEALARSRAEAAAAHFMGDKAKEYKITYVSDINKDSRTARVEFTRYANGLPAPFDRINVTVDSNGEVTAFSYSYRNMEFPAANLIPEKEAYDKLFENMKPNLYYTGFTDLQLKSHVYLTYKFDTGYILNAITGERINSSAEPYYSKKKPQEQTESQQLYGDIKGHRYEKEITKLFEYTVRISDEKELHPDEAISIGEFGELCEAIMGSPVIPYSAYIYEENKETGERVRIPNPVLEKKLTRKEIAKWYVYLYTDCASAAELDGVYKAPYSDVAEDNKYCGYIAIAKAKGYLPDTKTFSPNRGVTKAACLKLAYDYFNSGGECETLYELIEKLFTESKE